MCACVLYAHACCMCMHVVCACVCVCMASNAVHNDVLIDPPKVAEIQWNYLITVTSVVLHVLPYKCHVCRRMLLGSSLVTWKHHQATHVQTPFNACPCNWNTQITPYDHEYAIHWHANTARSCTRCQKCSAIIRHFAKYIFATSIYVSAQLFALLKIMSIIFMRELLTNNN